MQIRNKHYTKNEIMFLALWTLYSVLFFIFSASEVPFDYDVSTFYKYCSWGIVLLQLVALLLTEKWDRNTFIKLAIFLALMFVVELVITDRSLLIMILFIVLGQNIAIDKLMRYDIKLKIVLLIIIVGMSLLGIVENYSNDFYSGYKQAFGFGHPNTFTCFVLIILMEWLCLRYQKMRWFDWLGVIAGWAIIMAIGGGRASGYTFAVIFLLYWAATVIPKLFYTKISTILFALVTPFMAVLSFLMTYLYSEGNSIAVLLNTVLSNRFRYADLALSMYDIKLFGQEIEFTGTRAAEAANTSSFLVDNAYVHSALVWGGIVFVLIIILYSVLMVRLVKMKKIELALFCLFFVILGLGETYMLNVAYNISLICLLGVSYKLIDSEKLGLQEHVKK